MEIVPLQAVPNQAVTVGLGGQNCQVNVYQKRTGVFCDLRVDNALVVGGVIAENLNRIVRSTYLGFAGDLCFVDQQGASDPSYTGIGSRFLLYYLETSDLPALPTAASIQIVPADDIDPIMVGATSGTAGAAGYVPAPAAGQQNEVLLGSGVFGNVPANTFDKTFVFTSGGVVPVSSKVSLPVPFACTITGWTLVADQVGSAVVDVWMVPFASFPASSGNSITGSAQPALSATQKAQSSSLPGWTTSVPANSVLTANINSASTVTQLTLTLTISH